MAHVCCSSNKARCEIGYLTREEFEPGTLANEASWFKPADFERTSERQQQADLLALLDVASTFLRFEAGHSNETAVRHDAFDSSEFPCRYFLHGTNECNLSSIPQRGLLPGGTRGSRRDVHFTFDHTLTIMDDSLPPESDCILVAKIDALDDLEPRCTKNCYVLVDRVVPLIVS